MTYSNQNNDVPLATTTQVPASTSNTPGDWVDDTDNPAVEESTPELDDEQGFLGSDPNPNEVEAKDTLEDAQTMGLHETDEEHPDEVGMAKDVNAAEELQKAS